MQVGKSKLNTALLTQIIEAMKADDGEAILMNIFIEDSDKFRSTGCGTAGCVAGWAFMVHYAGTTKQARGLALMPNWELAAAKLLGIDHTVATSLFYMSHCHWGQTGDFDTLHANVRKHAAIFALEHLRDTGEVDWDRAIHRSRAFTHNID